MLARLQNSIAAVALVLALPLVVVALILGTTARPAGAQDGPQPPPVPEVTMPPAPAPATSVADSSPASDGTGPVVTIAPVAGPGTAGDRGAAGDGSINIDIGTPGDGPSQSVLLIVGLAVLSLAPSLVLMLSSFTRIVIVLSLTRNALGLQGIPPNQVLVGLALFLSLFVMSPTLNEVNDQALQPYMNGAITQEVAYDRASAPMHAFMLSQTRSSELDLMIGASGDDRPANPDDIPMSTVIPAFLLSELKTAFIMGFVIFIPFLIIDIVVAAVLMSLGMMMLPPVFVSLPFKLLLFVMVGGWSLIVQTLLASF
ncbi:MAG: flagellar type III secretion system pore protein FliP [Acidimicrobiia bacterium]|nr:flagellar type III secretion system pore protein FliP [Acidimicrobiia bacterium]MDH4365449.1 flagellar type III secretion system pore protein FliP [Acidimicrobiia bacterium]